MNHRPVVGSQTMGSVAVVVDRHQATPQAAAAAGEVVAAVVHDLQDTNIVDVKHSCASTSSSLAVLCSQAVASFNIREHHQHCSSTYVQPIGTAAVQLSTAVIL
jgi:hypothetical protein